MDDFGDDFDPRLHLELTKEQEEKLDLLESYKKLKWFNDVSTICAGGSFGE